MKISVVINTYNAEKYLAQVLDSVKLFDEVIICDMESTDKTLSVAQEYGCKCVTFLKGTCRIVEPARQFAIDQATNPWVLVVDADEVVTAELREYLYQQIERENPPAGIRIPRKNYFMGRFMHCHYPDLLLRFFQKEGTTWPPIIHVSPIVKGTIIAIPKEREELAFIHLANDGVGDILRKTDAYTEYELSKKKSTLGIGALLGRPLFRFLKSYFIKQGFRDGREGFIRASLESFYQFVLVAKIIEKRTKSSLK
ncbi:MAG: glycosyltransferase family 2 protein [Phocaeicola sp.]